MIKSRTQLGPHCLVAQDVALSRPKHEFESRWGHLNHKSFLITRGFFYVPLTPAGGAARPKHEFERAAHLQMLVGGTSIIKAFSIREAFFVPLTPAGGAARPKHEFEREAHLQMLVGGTIYNKWVS